jgi:hypothetical protein
MNAPRLLLLLISALLAAGWTLLVQNDPFFWDTVQLASKHAHFFYNHHLQWAALPSGIDSGHPPLLGYYVAVCWTLLGKSLVVSHWALWPFVTGIIYFATRLGQVIAGPQYGWLLALLLFTDPVMAGQSALVSPDILVILGLLGAVFGVQTSRKWLLMVSILLLCAASMRGMMVTAALALWVVLLSPFQWKKWLSELWPFLPGILLGLCFLAWHYVATGWVGHFEGSTWSAAFERADARGMMRNMAILGWRWADMNRFIEWALLGWLIYSSGWRTFIREQKTWILLLLCLMVLLSPSAILYKNLSAHRYFLPVFAGLHVLVFAGWMKVGFSLRTKTMVLAGLAVLLSLGNLWIYPRGVSMDWDSTLAHWPYHKLRADVVNYLQDNHIPLEEVGSTFPNVNTGEDLLLNGDERSFADLDFDHNKWVLASNVFNDLDEPEYQVLSTKWTLEKRWAGRGVWIELYRNREGGL